MAEKIVGVSDPSKLGVGRQTNDRRRGPLQRRGPWVDDVLCSFTTSVHDRSYRASHLTPSSVDSLLLRVAEGCLPVAVKKKSSRFEVLSIYPVTKLWMSIRIRT